METELTPAQEVARNIRNGNLASARQALAEGTPAFTIDVVYALADETFFVQQGRPGTHGEHVNAALVRVRTLVSTLHRPVVAEQLHGL